MKDLVEQVMTWNVYPDQKPVWAGWEYIPKTEQEIQKFVKVSGFPFYEDVEDACLQFCPESNRYVIAVDGFVEDITKKKFVRILKGLV